MDLVGVVQAIAAVGQAGAAIIVLVLTRRLVQLTRDYVAATDQYARTAQDQLAESTRSRLAAIQPLVSVVHADLRRSGDASLAGLRVALIVRNFGNGPALNGRIACSHPDLDLVAVLTNDVNGMVFVPTDTTITDAVWLHVDTGRVLREPIVRDVDVRIEYRDLAGHWWCTHARITMDLVVHGPGNYRAERARALFDHEWREPLESPTLPAS